MRALAIIRIKLKMIFRNPRFFLALFLPYMVMEPILKGIKNFSEVSGYRTGIWVFPFLTQHYFFQMILILGYVLIFCDAPFMDQMAPYCILRCGRKRWFIGVIGYIMTISFLYISLVFLLSIILLMPYIYIKIEWGKVLGTLGKTDSAMYFGTLILDYRMQASYSPIQATGYSLGMAWLNGILTGMLMFAISLFWKRITAVAFAGILAFTPYFAINFSNMFLMYYFSPPTWMNVTLLTRKKKTNMPTLMYGLLFMGTSLFFLMLAAWKKIKRRAIESKSEL